MKRLLLFFIVAVGTTLGASAGDYDYLIITSAGGATTAVNSVGTRVTFSGGQMHVTQNGETTDIALDGVTEMHFSSTSGVTEITTDDEDATVEVYTTSGQFMGSFDGTAEMNSRLKKGVYVVRQNGKTTKKTVR